MFIGCEGGEPALSFAANRYSASAFLYSSDFPHEPTIDEFKEEIEEVRDKHELTNVDKEAILHKNALRFYRL